MTRARWVAVIPLLASCGETHAPPAEPVQQAHSASLTASPGGTRLFVAHPDADSVSALDVGSRRLSFERRLAAHAPAVDADGRYTPSVAPRAIALDSTGRTLFVTGEASGRVYALDASSGKVERDAAVCAEPIGVLVSRDDERLFVACSADDEVVELEARSLEVVARLTTPRKPWALAWAADGETLFVTHFHGPGVSRVATRPLALLGTFPLGDGPPRPSPAARDEGNDPKEPHGVARGLYDVLARPGTDEVWVAHVMLGIDTPQPKLDFESTVFPALTVTTSAGAALGRLSVQAAPGDGGAFGDVVSGPHALAFSDDGRFAFVADTNSEDVLVVDARRRVELSLVRPLPGHMPEGLAWASGRLFVQERGSEDIALFRVDEGDGGVSVIPDGDPIATVTKDSMPKELRLGQKLFYSANSDDVATTRNHWVACASCHLEGRSDAVTWRFAQGPRDTPSNAGGLLDTGFLFRTADRTRVEDYWQTIDVEQGGHFTADEPSQAPLLHALAAYVNHAIPVPSPPSVDATHAVRGDDLAALRARGKDVFDRVGCGTCHAGSAGTDSGAGNASLDLGAPTVTSANAAGVVLHDVGTCVTSGEFPDVAHTDIQGHPRDACAFDTPQLRGLADSAPYLHDGSAATLADVVPIMLRACTTPGAAPPPVSDEETTALVEYLRGL